MFGLIHGLVQQCLVRPEIVLLMLGVDNAGKTTTLEQLKAIFNRASTIPPELIIPTIGLNLAKLRLPQCNVTVWDVGGQVKMRPIWNKYYARAHGLVFVVDAADRGRFAEVRRIFRQMLADPDLAGVPVLLMANKQDKDGATAAAELREIFVRPHAGDLGEVEAKGGDADDVDVETALQYSAMREQGVCALNGEGMEEGVRWLVAEASRTAKDRHS